MSGRPASNSGRNGTESLNLTLAYSQLYRLKTEKKLKANIAKSVNNVAVTMKSYVKNSLCSFIASRRKRDRDKQWSMRVMIIACCVALKGRNSLCFFAGIWLHKTIFASGEGSASHYGLDGTPAADNAEFSHNSPDSRSTCRITVEGGVWCQRTWTVFQQGNWLLRTASTSAAMAVLKYL